MKDEPISTQTISHPHFALTISQQPAEGDAPVQLNFSLQIRHPKIAAVLQTVRPILVQNLPLLLKIFGL